MKRVRSQQVITLTEQVVDIDSQIAAMRESIKQLEAERMALVAKLKRKIGDDFIYMTEEGHQRLGEFALTPAKQILNREKIEETYQQHGWRLPLKKARRSEVFRVLEVEDDTNE
jgi:hypothetical protein